MTWRRSFFLRLRRPRGAVSRGARDSKQNARNWTLKKTKEEMRAENDLRTHKENCEDNNKRRKELIESRVGSCGP
ncbi:hypothetical protein L596_023425 [Steinernema carpocapsae]|uniref:Uncharacterized protein n=1 Tax=Steinernema carpocapsae TaxID=34508 RepID=A0A4U5MDU1_STECR|nr:hypothetical protein L596_023425 [Steinernema carpocapsae]